MSDATKRSQFVNYELIRTGQLNANEIAVIAWVNTFSEYCLIPKLSDVANKLSWGERKLRYVINSLVSKGILRKTHVCFKKIKLQLVSLAEQAALKGIGMIKKVLRNSLKSQNKISHRQNKTGLNRQNKTDSIRSETIKNKTDNIVGNFNNLVKEMPKFMTKVDLDKRREMLYEQARSLGVKI